jgi:hypothetical protein
MSATKVKEFAKANGMKVSGTNGVPMLSKTFPAGAMWIECFDSYKEAYSFLLAAKNSYVIQGKDFPWSKPNMK